MAIALGSPTVSNSILSSVAGWLEFAKQLKFKNKKNKKQKGYFNCYAPPAFLQITNYKLLIAVFF